ncbi:MAG: AAA family ATPase [Acidobacteriota bacterium]
MRTVRQQRALRLFFKWYLAVRLTVLRLASALTPPKSESRSSAPPLLTEPLLDTLREALRQGHTCLSIPEIPRQANSRGKLIHADEAELAEACRWLHNQRHARLSGSYLSLPQCAAAEESIARNLTRIGLHVSPVSFKQVEEWVKADGASFSPEQHAVIKLLAAAPVAVLTGDPGTGKTSMVKALLGMFQKVGCVVHLTAPTGRAAQRLAEATEQPAQTLHRWLHTREPQGTTFRQSLSPAPQEVVIVDEASMLDIFLAARLVEACAAGTRLILVGDVNQLPPVGPGQVLRDFVGSGRVPVARLTQSFRQANQSRITAAAAEMKQGRVPELPAPGKEKSDCCFIEAETVEEIERLVVKAAARSLPARCGADPHSSIQVLTPMHKGPLGTQALNRRIQQALSGNGEERKSHPRQLTFRPGDRVLHTKNNYDLGVFNGECGNVEEVENEKVTVRFGERVVTYDQAFLDELTHGYAITVHRAQGSEYPFVIIPVHESQGQMLTRALLYTAFTRGRKMVVLIGSRQALAKAIANDRSSHRSTWLAHLLATTSTSESCKKAA